MKRITKSVVFVVIQFIAGFLLLITTPFLNPNFISLFLIFAGIFVTMWGIVALRKSVIRVTPDVDARAKLITSGPYKWVRHPLYSGIIFSCLGLLTIDLNYLRIIYFLVLIADLLLKLNYEEKLLSNHFKDYSEYKKKTARIIPFLY